MATHSTSPDSIGAGAPRITERMIEAGVKALEEGLLEDAVLRAEWFRGDLVREIYLAMAKAQRE